MRVAVFLIPQIRRESHDKASNLRKYYSYSVTCVISVMGYETCLTAEVPYM